MKRRYIPKGGGKLRPLGLPVLEDKLVQMAASRVLVAIYEADFLDCSKGYRGGRGARAATQELQHELFYGGVGSMVEADIESFFTDIGHAWAEGMLRERVDDRAFLRLVRKWLKAGILEEDGQVVHPATGTPQGGIISPVLANIYLRYALDLWVDRRVRKWAAGKVVYMRYADDFVRGFARQEDAARFLDGLRGRLGKFGLGLAEEKSGVLRFSRHDLKNSRPFTFLGFDFYWAQTRRGSPTVKRRTNKKKFRGALRELGAWLKKNRSRPLKWLGEKLRQKFQGYWNYYGVIGNSLMLSRYWWEARRLAFKWLNRRSQRKSYNWIGFEVMWKTLGISPPRIVEGR